jgi:hypothetical protein
MTYPDRYRPDVPRPGAHPIGWDLERVDGAPWPWEPPTQPVRAVPGWTNWNSGPQYDDRHQFAAAMAATYGPHPMDQVTKERRETRHGLHLLLTFCTFGLWALTGWPIAWAWNRFGPRRKIVTTYR